MRRMCACVRACVSACVCVCHSDQLRRLVGFAGDVARSLYREHLGTKVRQKKGKGGGGYERETRRVPG